MSILPPKNKKRIGIYGGSFDPVHHGHLILAREALEQLQFDQILFVPAATSPFKQTPRASADLRLAMLHAAIGKQEQFEVDDCELERKPPSYTIDTVARFRARFVDAEIFYLMGEDNVPDLPKWHRFEELKKLVQFVVLDRSGTNAQHGYTVVQRKIDISATEIRNRVARGLSIRYLVPPAVEEIIRQGNLYREGAK
jgi:nicotinate-nucleotide adenylyltransferase